MQLKFGLKPWNASLGVGLASLALVACNLPPGQGPTATASGAPTGTSAASPSPLGPRFQKQYRLALAGQRFANKLGVKVLHLPSGEPVVASALLGQMVVAKLTPEGEPLWGKGWQVHSSFQLGGVAAQGQELLFVGTEKDPEDQRQQVGHNLTLRQVVVGKLDAQGELLWAKSLTISPMSEAFINQSKVVALPEGKVGVLYANRLYLLGPDGALLQGHDFRGMAYDAVQQPDGSLWVVHHLIPPGYTIRQEGLTITAIRPDGSLAWSKHYGSDLTGLITPSRLHPIGQGRTRMAFGMNDHLKVKQRFGIAHLVLDAQGEVVESFSALTQGARDSGLFFTEIHDSWADGTHIYYSSTQGNGLGGLLLTGTLRYGFDGQISGFRDAPSGAVAVHQGQFSLPYDPTRLGTGFAFQLANNAFTQDLCRATTVVVQADPSFRLKVEANPHPPRAVQVEAEKAASLSPVAASLSSQAVACPN